MKHARHAHFPTLFPEIRLVGENLCSLGYPAVSAVRIIAVPEKLDRTPYHAVARSRPRRISVKLFKTPRVGKVAGDNHAKSAGIWMQIAKKASDSRRPRTRKRRRRYATVGSTPEAFDERTWLQRFTPRDRGVFGRDQHREGRDAD
jgi:hypothetical protein